MTIGYVTKNYKRRAFRPRWTMIDCGPGVSDDASGAEAIQLILRETGLL